MAIYLGLTADELCTIYRTQFPVFSGYDLSDVYDVNGRQVPKDVVRSNLGSDAELTLAERTAETTAGSVYTYELPFVSFDREADMRAAHAHFMKLMEKN